MDFQDEEDKWRAWSIPGAGRWNPSARMDEPYRDDSKWVGEELGRFCGVCLDMTDISRTGVTGASSFLNKYETETPLDSLC